MRQRLHLVVGLGRDPGRIGPVADELRSAAGGPAGLLRPAGAVRGPRPSLGTGTRAALRAVMALARRRRGVRVTLLHATGREGRAWPPRPEPCGASVHPALLLEAEAAAAELEQAGAEVTLVVTAGAAVPAMARRALYGDADLVVVGRTEGAEGSLSLGPTAAALVRAAPVPVWVVDPRHAGAVPALVTSTRDGAGLALAARLAQALRAPLHVTAASSVPWQSAPVAGLGARREHLDAARRRLASEALAAYRAVAAAGVEPTVHVGFDDPLPFLVETAGRLTAATVVLDAGGSLGRLPGSLVAARGAGFASPYCGSPLYEHH
jgi:nucleotide-binding universal stress UspA family protein